MKLVCSQTGKMRLHRPVFGQGSAAPEKTFTKKSKIALGF